MSSRRSTASEGKGDGDKELGKEAMTIYKRIKNRIKEEVNFESPSAKRR